MKFAIFERVFIILVSLMMSLFSEIMLIFNRCLSGLMSNLIKKSWKVSSLNGFISKKIEWLPGYFFNIWISSIFFKYEINETYARVFLTSFAPPPYLFQPPLLESKYYWLNTKSYFFAKYIWYFNKSKMVLNAF